MGTQCLDLAQRQSDPERLMWGHWALGQSLFFLGDFIAAHTHLTEASALYDPKQDRSSSVTDPEATCMSYLAMALWFLGYPNQAMALSRAALARSEELDYPFKRITTLNWSCIMHHLHRDMHITQILAETAVALCQKHSFSSRLSVSHIHLGWALAAQGQGEKGITLIHQGLTGWQDAGTKNALPFLLCMLAEAYHASGQCHEGLAIANEALMLVDQYSERWYEAELHRIQGELLLSQSEEHDLVAGSYFHQAISIAHDQHAKSWELRAATSLAKLWQSQHKRQEAYDLLAPVYNWFTEGFDTADLIEAKSLLGELCVARGGPLF
jgi:predicted ATPase